MKEWLNKFHSGETYGHGDGSEKHMKVHRDHLLHNFAEEDKGEVTLYKL